jgi:hypothetical protein
MTDKTSTDDANKHPSQLESLAKEVALLRTIISGLVALLVVAFGAGVLWAGLQTYEGKVDNYAMT